MPFGERCYRAGSLERRGMRAVFIAVALSVTAAGQEVPAPVPVLEGDFRVSLVIAQRDVSRARAEALRRFAALLQTTQGTEWLKAAEEATRRGRALAVVEAQARIYCEAFAGMEYVSGIVQCAAKAKAAERLEDKR